MSSARFEVTLRPDSAVRRWRLVFALFSYTAGFLLIISMSLEIWPRLALATIWLLFACNEIRRFIRGSSLVHAFRLDERGVLLLVDSRGGLAVISLLPGSFLIGRFGWLRVLIEPGFSHGELLLAGHHGAREWRQFHVLWRIGNKSIGASGRS